MLTAKLLFHIVGQCNICWDMDTKTTELPSPPGVGLVQKTLQILDLFQRDAPNWSQGEIAQATGMPKSTVNRLVKFLTDRGYLTLIEERNRYSLGPASIDLGRRASAQFDFRGICRPILERLSQNTSETVMLTSVIGSGSAVRCVDQIESTHEGLRVFEQIGSIFPLHAGASPKAVLAALSPAGRDQYMSRPLTGISSQAPVDPAILRDDIVATIERGYAISHGETYEGVVGIAAAFYWSNKRPAGSLAVALPVQRASAEVVARIGSLLKIASEDVSAILSVETPSQQIREAS